MNIRIINNGGFFHSLENGEFLYSVVADKLDNSKASC